MAVTGRTPSTVIAVCFTRNIQAVSDQKEWQHGDNFVSKIKAAIKRACVLVFLFSLKEIETAAFVISVVYNLEPLLSLLSQLDLWLFFFLVDWIKAIPNCRMVMGQN